MKNNVWIGLLLLGLGVGQTMVFAEENPGVSANPPAENSAQVNATATPAIASTAPAEENFELLENIFLSKLPQVTIASDKAEDPDQAPADVFVITGEEMIQRGYRTLVELVEDLPGVNLNHNVSDMGQAVAIRGIQNNKMFRLMINGMPIDPVLAYGMLWSDRFTIDGIERVEFILGPYPALYGRNTYSGIMNVVTQTGEQVKGAEVKALYGSWDKAQGSIVAGGKTAGIDVFLSVFKNVSKLGRNLAQEYPELYGRQAREGQLNEAVDYPFAISFNDLDPEWTLPWDATDMYLRLEHDNGLFLDASWNRYFGAKAGNN